MNYSATFKSLCLPSKVYFVFAFIAILMSIVAPSTFGGVSMLMHLVHIVYVIFWTWVLNLICGAGYKWISWVLVLAPFLLFFFLFVLTLNAPPLEHNVHKDAVPMIVLSSQ
jgi:hypothetical protein